MYTYNHNASGFILFYLINFQLQTILEKREIEPEFSKIAEILGVSNLDMVDEWRILRRLESANLSTEKGLIDLALSNDKRAMFQTFSTAATKLLLLPVGTATVERSFSTMNRILCSERCRLLPEHVCQLMQISIEGPDIPDIRSSSDSDRTSFDSFIDAAYQCWIKKPRRRVE